MKASSHTRPSPAPELLQMGCQLWTGQGVKVMLLVGRRVKLSVLGRAVSNAGSLLEGAGWGCAQSGVPGEGRGRRCRSGPSPRRCGRALLAALGLGGARPYGPALHFLLGVFVGDGFQLSSSFCPGLTTGNASLCPFSSLNSNTQRINL